MAVLKLLQTFVIFYNTLQIIHADNISPQEIVCSQSQEYEDHDFKIEATHLTIKNCKLNKLQLANFQAKEISLQDNWITMLPSDAFSMQLERLEFINNTITNIGEDLFSNGSHLETLVLQNNNFIVSSAIFKQLSSLKNLEILGERHLESIDNTLEPLVNLVSLKMHDNLFTEVSPSAFQNLKKLVILHMSNNTYTPSVDFFNANENLGVLDLKSNEIQQMPNLEHLSNVQFLYLDNNDIRLIQKSNFGINLVKLQKIFLSNNRLSKLQEGIFKNLVSLYWLDLSLNNIKEVDSGAFQGLTKLRFLSLTGNEIQSVDKNLFKDLVSLAHLEFGYNKISFIPSDAFTNTKRLGSLSLGNNRIQALPQDIFANLKVLGRLDLQHNDISSIHPTTFGPLIYLRHLDLENNKISRLDNLFTSLKSLKFLWLTDNSLTYLDDKSFRGLVSLSELYLDRNTINKIEEGTFKTNSALTIVSLTNNHLQGLNKTVFAGLNKLVSLNLD